MDYLKHLQDSFANKTEKKHLSRESHGFCHVFLWQAYDTCSFFKIMQQTKRSLKSSCQDQTYKTRNKLYAIGINLKLYY